MKTTLCSWPNLYFVALYATTKDFKLNKFSLNLRAWIKLYIKEEELKNNILYLYYIFI